jgi:lysophospholipase L1-like esterase
MAASTLYRDYDYDFNNLLPPIEGNGWRRDGNTPSITPTQAFSTEIGIERAARIGLIGTQAARGLTCSPLVIPAGITGGIFEVQMAMPSGDPRVNLAIYNDALNTRLFEDEKNVVVGAGVKSFPLSVPTLAAGQYFAAIETNHASQQAKPIVWDVRFTPNPGTGLLSNFKRFLPRAGILHGDIKTNWVTNRFKNQSPYSRWFFEVTIPKDTISTKCAVRTFVENNTAPIIGGCVTFYVQGEGWSRSTETVADQTYSYNEFEVPFRPNANGTTTLIIGFRNSIQTHYAGHASSRGSFFVDAFFPADWAVRPVPPPVSGRVLVEIGDSLTLGAQATLPESEGMGNYEETRFPGLVVYEAASSRWLLHIAADAATCAATAQEIAKANPTDVGIQIGVNDKINNAVANWTPATIETAYNNLFDAIHAATPWVFLHIYEPYTCSGGTETNPVNGLTMAQVRTACRNAANRADRAGYCHLKPAADADMPQSAFLLGDGIHLNTDGQAIAGVARCAFMGI